MKKIIFFLLFSFSLQAQETPRFLFFWYQNSEKTFKFDLGWRNIYIDNSFEYQKDVGSYPEFSLFLSYKF